MKKERIMQWFKKMLKLCPMLVFTLLLAVVYLTYSGISALASAVRESDRLAAVESMEEQRESEQATEPVETLGPSGRKEFCKVDESYFDDALFLGNSRIRLFGEYSPLGNAVFYGVDCLTVYDILEEDDEIAGYNGVMDLLQRGKFGKVYIAIGINECAYPTDSFMDHYQELIDTIHYYQPDALIFVEDIMYVAKPKAEAEPVFETPIIDEKNERIAQLDNGIDVFYLPLNELVDDGTGYMGAEFTGDNVHLDATHYHIWADYLMEHGIVDSKHPANPGAQNNPASGN